MPLHDAMFARPPVYATAEDLTALKVAAQQAGAAGPGAGLLREELRRLALAGEGAAPFVRLGDVVHYRDLRTKRERQVRIVTPEAAEPEENWISVLAPIGAALIGLSDGAVFRWLEPSGRPRAVKVIEILR